MELKITALVVGALGICANVFIYQQKSSKHLLVYKLISDVIWAVHYLLLGGYSGMAVACIGIVRESIFLNKKHKWAQSNLWLLLFVLLSIGSAALTWKSPLNLLPATASVLSVFGFWRANPKLSRALAYPISICMLTYDIFILSYMGIANEIFTLLSTTVAIVITIVKAKKEIKEKG
ncbi:MAG: YgjV family protein [Clostridia bacterium]|nr:YgjV family protein [Clostridia bacterium]